MKLKPIQYIIDILRGKPIVNNSVNRQDNMFFAQSGEDCIVKMVLNHYFKKEKINYLDIGAHHSRVLSNTYYFYLRGNRGVLVEPNPKLFEEIKKNRKQDICLNCGIGLAAHSQKADFYVMEESSVSTFSKEDAELKISQNNDKLIEILKIDMIDINVILNDYFKNGLDFLSIDVEGLDLNILKSIDWKTHRPTVICVETLNPSIHRTKLKKDKEIIKFLEKLNYFVYADTFINTIFVDKIEWENYKN